MSLSFADNITVTFNERIQNIIRVCQIAYDAHHVDLHITSGCSGTHMPTSLHYQNRALDIRTKNIPTQDDANDIMAKIKASLGPDYDVVVEGDHLHVEFDPKATKR